jgi:hypothetical protein
MAVRMDDATRLIQYAVCSHPPGKMTGAVSLKKENPSEGVSKGYLRVIMKQSLHLRIDEHSKCSDPKNFVESKTRDGAKIRTTCRVCGEFVGYRPVVFAPIPSTEQKTMVDAKKRRK